MDNTPRCRYAYSRYLWIDAISQQALSALYISRLLQAVGNKDESKKRETEYNRLKTVINEHYWDEESGCYYDIRKTDGKPSKVITPASFRPLLAEVADSSRAGRMVRLLKDPEILGGEIPIPSVARNNLRFGTVVTDIVKDGNTVTVSSNKEYSPVIREDSFSIQPGTTVLTIDDHPGC